MMGLPLRQIAIGIAFLSLYLVAGAALDRDGRALALFGNMAVLGAASLVIATVVRRRREWAGVQRLFWDTVAVGVAVWVVGHLGWAYANFVNRQSSWLEWHTVFTLSGGLAPLLALIARPHRGVRTLSTGTVGVDIATCGLFAGFLYAYFVLVPSVTGLPTAQPLLLQSVQVFRFALMAGMCAAAIVARDTAWGPTYRALAVGATIGAFLRIATSLAIADGTYRIGTLYDFAWIVPFLFSARAAAGTPPSPESDGRPERSSTTSFALLAVVPVLLIPLVGYSALSLGAHSVEAASIRGLLTGLASVVGLGLLTLRLVVQRAELQRVDSRAQLLAAATEQTGDLILIARADGVVEHANDAFLRAVGFKPGELSSLRFPQPLDHACAGLADEIPAALLASGVWRGTLRRRRRDGTSFAASSVAVAIRATGDAVTHFVAVERDATEELKLRDQLVHSERLSAVGELVAGVAHEINNPLQAIVGCVELMLEDQSDVAQTRRDLESVRREAGRAGHIVRSLLSFVRHSAPDRGLADLNQIVRHTSELREYHLQQQNITLVVETAPEPLPVLVDREEIQQVVLNLLMNAEQAIDAAAGRGTIRVRTAHAAGQQIVEVIDDGPGISRELRGRVFEPFFTTKDVGEGTGLGLSISHGIAAAHGGALELCDAHAGACFRLTLPAHQVAAQPLPRAPIAGSSVRVLVVDDEEPIRRLLARLLARRGFEVAEAATVGEAVRLAGTFGPVLVVCDVGMPDGGGVALHRQLRATHPELQFIFVTGDASSLLPLDQPLEELTILAKPFTAADLDMLLGRFAAPLRVPTA